MGTSSFQQNPVLESLQVLIKSRGFNLSDSQALQTWTYLLRIAPWLPNGSLFDWDTRNRVAILIYRAQVEKGETPSLGAIATVTALKVLQRERPCESHTPRLRLLHRETLS